MAITHISFNDQTNHGRQLRAHLNKLEEAVEGLDDLVKTMALMLDGDGTQSAHFTSYIITKFGFPDAATAKACWDELNSVSFKLQTNASVSDVNAAIKQVVNKHR
jgi:tetrahydromethanopterin S-methyltransferase subunit H